MGKPGVSSSSKFAALEARIARWKQRQEKQKEVGASAEINAAKQAASGHVVLGKGDPRLRKFKITAAVLAALLAGGAPVGAYYAGKHVEREKAAEVQRQAEQKHEKLVELLREKGVGHADYWARVKADLEKKDKYLPKESRLSTDDLALLEELCRNHGVKYPSQFNLLSEAFKVSGWHGREDVWEYENKAIKGAYNYLTDGWDHWMHDPIRGVMLDMLGNRKKYDGLIRKLGRYGDFGVEPINPEIGYH